MIAYPYLEIFVERLFGIPDRGGVGLWFAKQRWLENLTVLSLFALSATLCAFWKKRFTLRMLGSLVAHASVLFIVAGVIVRDERQPGDVRAAGRYPVVAELGGQAQHHILQGAYDVMERRKQILLSRFAAFRSPMDYEALLALNPYKSKAPFDAALDELIERGLLLFEPVLKGLNLLVGGQFHHLLQLIVLGLNGIGIFLMTHRFGAKLFFSKPPLLFGLGELSLELLVLILK